MPADVSWVTRLYSRQRTARPGNDKDTADSALVELRMHAVYSPAVLLLSQIVFPDARSADDTHAPLAEGPASPSAAISALNDSWALLQQQKEEAGVASCTAWSCRLFATPKVLRWLGASVSAPACCSSGSEHMECGVATSTKANPSRIGTERVEGGLAGATVCEVEGLHDGEGPVAWALRVLVLQ